MQILVDIVHFRSHYDVINIQEFKNKKIQIKFSKMFLTCVL